MDKACAEEENCLLQEIEHLLELDPLIDEIGFIHPTQLAALKGDADVDSSESPRFFSRDHKLGVSTKILFLLYKQAKEAFFDVVARYRTQEGAFGSSGTSNELEDGVMKHSRALLLVSADFSTAWNSRKAIALKKHTILTYMDELRLSELILSYSAKSDQAWSHRRWVIKRIAGEVPNLQEILGRESELVENIAERSKMNYRAWNHRCWLVSYMTIEQVLYELNKSRAWAGLHVADSSCFHYRRRMIMRILEVMGCERASGSDGGNNDIYVTLREELAWNENLIKRYLGREALWLYRRFLSLIWLKIIRELDSESCGSERTTSSDDGPIFLENELHLFNSCSTIPDDDFDDFHAQAMCSATYILWLAKQLPKPQAIALCEKLKFGEMKALLNKLCPQRSFVCDLVEQSILD